MKYILLAGIMLLQMGLISGCTGDKEVPSLGGHTQYPGALPPPGRIQQNNAIQAQTMISPVQP